jgi:hypothetical protein
MDTLFNLKNLEPMRHHLFLRFIYFTLSYIGFPARLLPSGRPARQCIGTLITNDISGKVPFADGIAELPATLQVTAAICRAAVGYYYIYAHRAYEFKEVIQKMLLLTIGNDTDIMSDSSAVFFGDYCHNKPTGERNPRPAIVLGYKDQDRFIPRIFYEHHRFHSDRVLTRTMKG